MSDTRQSLSDLKAVISGDTEAVAPAAASPATNIDAVGEIIVPAAPVIVPMPLREREVDNKGRSYATGRRKDAVARVWIMPGTGRVIVNGRDQHTYFARPTLRLVINQPFSVTDRADQFDVICTVKGGGLSGQAG